MLSNIGALGKSRQNNASSRKAIAPPLFCPAIARELISILIGIGLNFSGLFVGGYREVNSHYTTITYSYYRPAYFISFSQVDNNRFDEACFYRKAPVQFYHLCKHACNGQRLVGRHFRDSCRSPLHNPSLINIFSLVQDF